MPQTEDRDSRELWSTEEEPHMKRRREIMKAHPEVKQLVGPCAYTKYITAFLVGTHLATAYCLSTYDMTWW